MDIQLVVQDSIGGKIYDISELVKNISWSTEVAGQPGKLTFDYVQTPDVVINEGSVVYFKVNGQNVFYGYAFIRKQSKDGVMSITAYDQMRYLKNKDTYAVSDMTASQVFERICKDFKLNARVVNPSSYVLSARVHDNKSLFEIIDWGITETMAYSSTWYMIRDNFGTLEFIDLNTLKTDLFIGDESLLTGYDFESSIDENTYNQIKIVSENTQTKKREVIVRDSSTISRWGLLQYFETASENANAAQLEDKAKKLLSLKNTPTKKLRINCLGDLKVYAGCGIVFGVSELSNEGFAENKYFVVTSCTHTFSNNMHTMTLDLQVSV